MSTLIDDQQAARTRRSRTSLVSFLGAIVRRMGNWMPIAGTVELMADIGLDAPSVRTAVFRLKHRGWLISQTHAAMRGYALTPLALDALAAGDGVIWHARQPADLDAGWCIVNFSVPESARAMRHKLRSHLAALGFGNVGTAMWIAPARMQSAAEQAIKELGLARYSAVFVGSHVGGRDLTELVSQSWDLDQINDGYREFIARFEPDSNALQRTQMIDPGQAFAKYLAVLDHWRKLPFRDPGLPKEVLPLDWAAPAAGALFEQLVSVLEGRALAHAARCWTPSGSEVADESSAASSGHRSN